jgi:transposase
MPIVNPDTGECRQVQVFVAVLGASNYTFAIATENQKSESWLNAHNSMFNFFGGVAQLLVPDNLKAGVIKANRFEPTLNASYQALANHYGCAVMPARPRKPKDKAKAENAVLIVERWIMARLRHQVFHTLVALNQQIKILLDDLNHRPFQRLPGCRQDLFEQLDKPALKPLGCSSFKTTASL